MLAFCVLGSKAFYVLLSVQASLTHQLDAVTNRIVEMIEVPWLSGVAAA
jgi:hypothetical protein